MDFGLHFGVRFWGILGVPFFDPFWASVGRSLKIAKVPRCFKNKHLGAFQASEAIFFEGLLSVDFGAEKALRRYVYNGFSDFLFS